MSENNTIRASTKSRYTITSADLPLCCPMPNMRLWDAHPRVYLPIAVTGTAVCPYCDAEYVLSDSPADAQALVPQRPNE